MITRRCTDPVYLQYIWDALEVPFPEKPFNFDYILNFIRQEKDPKCSNSKLQLELTNAIRDQCIIIQDSEYKKADWGSIPSYDNHDSYCFQCHKPGPVIDCPTCFRVYHEDCLSGAANSENFQFLPDEEPLLPSTRQITSFPPSYSCPACQKLKNTSLNADTSTENMQSIFSIALEKMRSKSQWRTLYTIGYVNDSQRNRYFSINQTDTKVISDKLRAKPDSSDAYANRTELIFELDILVHNTTVIYGSRAEMTNAARQVRSQMQKEMHESSLCVDCYINSKGRRPDARQIVMPCRKPHRLLWFHHSSWSFRPCKVLFECSDGYEVICFDGRREREFVPAQRAVDMSFTASQLGLRMTASLKRALEETELYSNNQKNRSGIINNDTISHHSSSQSSGFSALSLQTPSSEFTTSSEYRCAAESFRQKSISYSFPSTEVTSYTSGLNMKRRRETTKKLESSIKPVVSSTPFNFCLASELSSSNRETTQCKPVFGLHRNFGEPSLFTKGTPSSSEVPHTTLIDSSVAPRIRSDSCLSSSSEDSSLTSSSSIGISKPDSSVSNRSKLPSTIRSVVALTTLLPTKRRCSMIKEPPEISSCSSISSNVSSGSTTALACSSPKNNSSLGRDGCLQSSNLSSRSHFFSRAAADSDSSLSACEPSPPVKSLSSCNKNLPRNDSSLASDSEEDVCSRVESTGSSENHSRCPDSALNDRLYSWHRSLIKTSPDRWTSSNKVNPRTLLTNVSSTSSYKRRDLEDTSNLKSTEASPKRSKFVVEDRNKEFIENKKPLHDHPHSTDSPIIGSVSNGLIQLPPSCKSCHAFGFTAASSSASSVSPAALSSSSGIGSSIMSDQKSVDASPADMAGGHSNTSLLHVDATMIKSIEERVQHRMTEQIAALIQERDQAKADLLTMETYVKELTRKHRNEIRETKQLSWCSKCLKQALYHCCGGVAYCCSDCQLKDWADHSRKCTRVNDGSQTAVKVSN